MIFLDLSNRLLEKKQDLFFATDLSAVGYISS